MRALGHCGACHSPRNLLLAEIPERALSGGIHFHPVSPGKQRLWAAVNLTPATTGLGAWSTGDIASYLKTGHSRKAGRFGPMDSVIAEGTRHLTENDAVTVANFLKSLPPIEGETASVPDPGQWEPGSAVYAEHCEDCHMASGRGNLFKAPPLAAAPSCRRRHRSRSSTSSFTVPPCRTTLRRLFGSGKTWFPTGTSSATLKSRRWETTSEAPGETGVVRSRKRTWRGSGSANFCPSCAGSAVSVRLAHWL